MTMIPLHKPHYDLSPGHEFKGDPVSCVTQTSQKMSNHMQQGANSVWKKTLQTNTRNTIMHYNTQHRNNTSNSVLKLHSAGDIQSPNHKKTTRCWLMCASLHRNTPTKKHPETSSVNAVASNDETKNNLYNWWLPSWMNWDTWPSWPPNWLKLKGELPTFRTTDSLFFHVPHGSRVGDVDEENYETRKQAFARRPTRHRQKCIVSGSFTGAPEVWFICKQRATKANTDGWSHSSKGVSASSPPSMTQEEWEAPRTYVFTFSKGICWITGHQKIKMGKGCTGNLLNTK